MVVRFVGAVLITAGAAAWGMSGVFRLRARVRSLNALVSAVNVMTSEICDRLTPMPELLEALAQEATYPASQLFKNAADILPALGSRPFSALWSQAVKATPELLLTPPEELALTELGMSLGRYNAGEQRAALQYARRRFEDHARRAEAERERNSKVHAFLGVAAGVFAVIILL